MDIEADKDVTPATPMRRWLAWAAAALVVAGAVSAGVASARNDAADERIVAAAGDVTNGVTPPAGQLVTPTTIPETTTTAAPVTTSSTTVPATSTVKPTTTTVKKTTTTQPARTTTTAAPGLVITAVNQYPLAVNVTVNGKAFQLAPGQQLAPFEVPVAPNGNDSVSVGVVAEPTCGIGDAGGIFHGPGRYRLTIVTGQGGCGVVPPILGPIFQVTPA